MDLGGIYMDNILHYKGYLGTVEYSFNDNMLFGKVLDVNTLISYEGHSVDELREDFESSVDDYLEMCEKNGVEPEKICKETVQVRLRSAIYRKACVIAESRDISLNKLIENVLVEKIEELGV